MHGILLTWLGRSDLAAAAGSKDAGLGPIGQAVDALVFDEVVILCDYGKKEGESYVRWLKHRTKAPVRLRSEHLTGPTQFGEIYEAARKACDAVREGAAKEQALTFHLSPGTPAMAAVWVILSKTRYPAELIESSRDHGVKTVSVPFDISADFIPDLLRRSDDRLQELSAAPAPAAPEFAAIIHRSAAMRRLLALARRLAVRSLTVLLEGESGTGKELLARAIHRASPRWDRPFVAVNCGAIPTDLVESELFGHERGAFTGAVQARKGYFEEANGGTLFLDELGELPLSMQVKLLRLIQEGEFTRLGSARPTKVDVRIIAATNRVLTDEIAGGRFREDLFYRLAVAVLKLPPLRDRREDLGPLIDHFMAQVNSESEEEPGFKKKSLSAGARNVLLTHNWPGNVRELLNTLRRAVVWSEGATIRTEDLQEALLPTVSSSREAVLNRALGEGLDLTAIIASVARHYLDRAMEEAHGNKSKAARLVGLPSYQTLTNWLERYGVKN